VMRALVVDDEENVRRVVARAIASGGHEVTEVEDGLAALDALSRQPYDVVITDWNMPGMRGDALLRECRRSYPTTDVFLITGYGTIERAVDAIKAGAVDYITKPLDVEAIRRKVELRFAERRMMEARRGPDPLDSAMVLGRALGRGATPEELVEQTLDLVQTSLRPSGVQLILHAGALSRESLEIYRGWREAFMADVSFGGLVQRLEREGRQWVLADPRGGTLEGRTVGHGLVALVATEGAVLGSLAVARARDERAFDEADGRALHLLGLELATALGAADRRRAAPFGGDAGRTLYLVAQTLVAVIETYDDFTYQHSCRVAEIAEELARLTGLNPTEVERVRIASMLHDIGKLGVGNPTLHKSGELSATEVDLIKLHPTLGARILSGLEVFNAVVPMVLHHHEWVNGDGYPDGLKGTAIPLEARIIAVADVYDSLISDRPYRQAMDWAAAVEELRRVAGTQLDASLVRLWLRYLGDDRPVDLSVSAGGQAGQREDGR